MDKKTPLLACFLAAALILTLPACFAEDDEDELNEIELFDGWVTEGENFTVSGLEVYVSAGNGGQGIFLFPQKTIMLELDKCEMIDRLKVCMKEWEYVIGGTVEIHGDDKQKFRVVITLPAPDLTITRDAEETSLEIGESTRVTITLKNEGTEPATGLTYTETVPQEFEITITSNLIKQGNTLSWQGSIPKGGEKKFAYNIKAKSGFSGSIYSVLEYKIHEVPKTTTNSLNFAVTSLIGIDQRLEKSSLSYGEEERVYITVKNKRSEDMNTELYVEFPKPLYVVATHFNRTYGEGYLWEGTIEGGESQEFITRIRADEGGLHKINVSVKGIFTDNKISNVQEFIEVDVAVDEALFYFIPIKIKKGEESTVKLYMKNPNTYGEFRNIDIWAESDYFNGTAHLEKFRAGDYNEVLLFKIKPEEEGMFMAKADAVYYVGSKKYIVKKEENIEVEEEVEEVEEPEPEVNETEEPEINDTIEPDDAEDTEVNETEEEAVKVKWTEKELFIVDYVRGKIESIMDSVSMIFGLKKAVREAVAGEE